MFSILRRICSTQLQQTLEKILTIEVEHILCEKTFSSYYCCNGNIVIALNYYSATHVNLFSIIRKVDCVSTISLPYWLPARILRAVGTTESCAHNSISPLQRRVPSKNVWIKMHSWVVVGLQYSAKAIDSSQPVWNVEEVKLYWEVKLKVDDGSVTTWRAWKWKEDGDIPDVCWEGVGKMKY